MLADYGMAGNGKDANTSSMPNEVWLNLTDEQKESLSNHERGIKGPTPQSRQRADATEYRSRFN